MKCNAFDQGIMLTDGDTGRILLLFIGVNVGNLKTCSRAGPDILAWLNLVIRTAARSVMFFVARLLGWCSKMVSRLRVALLYRSSCKTLAK